ncbi:L-aspartate oxidase [Asaccharospora irregularis]|uniref:L-aspartate oxidase n=1 Tax=Asaccharospora irregularis DSM 2635 TaxID=1121321 RepID=A0A1M5TLU0_9FIRM|nr:L-aspartate oxidase [Asaccharospora irregularis]SHH51648.1 L-aspartate oxidase [Asaccharospora irregularis DSM 2635]
MTYDVVIIGSGISGLYTSINLSEDLKVLVISKDELKINNSYLAQGGIAVVLDKDDNYEIHINDTLIAGEHTNNIKNLDILVKEGPIDVMKLVDIGVDFDRDEHGNLSKTLEGGHSKKRIVHHKDKTGKEVINTLLNYITNKENISTMDKTLVADINKENDLFGVVILRDEELKTIYCKSLVLATGGIGKIYKYTTNSKIATGDGIALAHNLGAAIKNISKIQFHPTALNLGSNERFLVSEAVRGEGAFLLNKNGNRFMLDYDERGELAPRNVVAKGIYDESIKLNSEEIYIDISHKDSEFIKNRFPNIYDNCLKYGLDITKDKIPVFPCEHYLMGGIDVNENSESSIENLYAVGECSHTGIHGNNRLASNSLLEGLVFARRAAQNINKQIKNDKSRIHNKETKVYKKGTISIDNNLRNKIQNIIQDSYFIVLDKEKSKKGIIEINNIITDLKSNDYIRDVDYYEIRNMAIISKLVLGEVLNCG